MGGRGVRDYALYLKGIHNQEKLKHPWTHYNDVHGCSVSRDESIDEKSTEFPVTNNRRSAVRVDLARAVDIIGTRSKGTRSVHGRGSRYSTPIPYCAYGPDPGCSG